MLAYVILAYLAVSVSAAAVEDDCSGLQLFTCMFLVDVDKISMNEMAETDASLDIRCNETMPIMKCFNDHAVKCPGGEMKNLKKFFIVDYETLKSICDRNDSLRKKYLENAKCLNQHRKQTEKKCGKIFRFEFGEELTKEHCKIYAETFRCTYKDVEQTCGKTALEVAKQILTPATMLMDNICSDV